MKILRAYPKTLNQVIEIIVKLPRELEYVICLNIYEIAKNLPEEMLKQKDENSLFKDIIPIVYINRF